MGSVAYCDSKPRRTITVDDMRLNFVPQALTQSDSGASFVTPKKRRWSIRIVTKGCEI